MLSPWEPVCPGALVDPGCSQHQSPNAGRWVLACHRHQHQSPDADRCWTLACHQHQSPDTGRGTLDAGSPWQCSRRRTGGPAALEACALRKVFPQKDVPMPGEMASCPSRHPAMWCSTTDWTWQSTRPRGLLHTRSHCASPLSLSPLCFSAYRGQNVKHMSLSLSVCYHRFE